MEPSNIRVHQKDLPHLENYQVDSVAIDTETLGLNPHRDRLCVVQLSPGDGSVDLVQISKGQEHAPNLVSILANQRITKIFHYARFDIAILKKTFDVCVTPIFCTKIASKLVRTYTQRHGLQDLCNDAFGISFSKQQQCSDWGKEVLNPAQINYAAMDVLYLHQLKQFLEARLEREDRTDLAKACFDFLPIRADLDLKGWAENDIFAHA